MHRDLSTTEEGDSYTTRTERERERDRERTANYLQVEIVAKKAGNRIIWVEVVKCEKGANSFEQQSKRERERVYTYLDLCETNPSKRYSSSSPSLLLP